MNGMHMKRLSFLVLNSIFAPFVFYDTHDAWQISKIKDTQSLFRFMISKLMAW